MNKYQDNKINAVNELYSFINAVSPLYCDYLKKGFKLNVGNVFSKKDKEALAKIAASLNPSPKIRHHFHVSDYSCYIKFDVYWQDSEHGSAYHDDYFYILSTDYLLDSEGNRTGEKRWKVEEPQVKKADYYQLDIEDAENTITKLEVEKRAIQDKIDNIVNTFRPFFKDYR